MLRQPLLGGDRERTHATRFHHSDRVSDVEPRHMDIAVGEIAQDLGAAALERNVHEIKTRALGEDFGIDLLIAADAGAAVTDLARVFVDRKSTRLNSSHLGISYAVFCLKKK